MLILLPPSESKTGRARGRSVVHEHLSFPELGATRQSVAEAVAEVSAHPDAAATLGVSPNLTAEIARNLVLHTAPATARLARLLRRPLRRARLRHPRQRGQASREPLARRRLGPLRRGAPHRRDRPLPALHGGQPPRRRPARQRVAARAAPRPARPRRPWRRRRLPLQHVCRGVDARGRPRRSLGAGPRARRHPHGQAHPWPGGPGAVPRRAGRPSGAASSPRSSATPSWSTVEQPTEGRTALGHRRHGTAVTSASQR